MDQINQNVRTIEDYNRMLEDSRGKKEMQQRELDDKINEIDKSKSSLGDLDKMYREKIDIIEKQQRRAEELVSLRNKTQSEGLRSIMALKETLEVDPATYYLSQAHEGKTQLLKLLNNVYYDYQ